MFYIIIIKINTITIIKIHLMVKIKKEYDQLHSFQHEENTVGLVSKILHWWYDDNLRTVLVLTFLIHSAGPSVYVGLYASLTLRIKIY